MPRTTSSAKTERKQDDPGELMRKQRHLTCPFRHAHRGGFPHAGPYVKPVLIAVTAFLIALSSACGSPTAGTLATSTPALDPVPPPTEAPTLAPTPRPTVPGGVILITQASDGGVVTLHVGDHLQIALGDQLQWTLDPPDGIVLTRPVQSYLPVRGTQAIWLATAVGQAAIRATGIAPCPSGRFCAQFVVLFMTTVVVR